MAFQAGNPADSVVLSCAALGKAPGGMMFGKEVLREADVGLVEEDICEKSKLACGTTGQGPEDWCGVKQG